MLPEARLDIVLSLADGAVAGIAIHSSRLVQASRLFAGRRPDEVLALLPTVFSLCGTAQAMAGLTAMEQAARIVPAPAQAAARRLLVLGETVAEHGLALARDWPDVLGEPHDMAAARAIKTAMAGLRNALYPDGDWRQPGGGALRPDRAQIRSSLNSANAALRGLLGGDPDDVLADGGRLRSWMANGAGVAARLLAQVTERRLADFGAAAFLPMPAGGAPDLADRLAGDDRGAFVTQPDSAGTVFETGPLARHHAHPLLAALVARHGTGLLTRLAARLVEVSQALKEAARLVQDLTETAPGAAQPEDGTGLGLVEAARGLLAHRVELEDGRVKRYQILAPTEWNFHPQGPLARALAGSAAGPGLEEAAGLLVHALDPCVACAIRTEPAHA